MVDNLPQPLRLSLAIAQRSNHVWTVFLLASDPPHLSLPLDSTDSLSSRDKLQPVGNGTMQFFLFEFLNLKTAEVRVGLTFVNIVDSKQQKRHFQMRFRLKKNIFATKFQNSLRNRKQQKCCYFTKNWGLKVLLHCLFNVKSYCTEK